MAGKSTTIQLATADMVFLERRGARSLRGGGTFSRSMVLHRALQGLRSVLDQSDPRATRGFPQPFHEAVIELLRFPWDLHPLEIQHLDSLLAHSQGFAGVLSDKQIDPGEFLSAIAALSFAEKFALVDHAVLAHGPAAAAAHPEEPWR